MKKTVLLIIFLAVFSNSTFAQGSDKKEKHNTYLKFGWIHGQGNIVWADYRFNSPSVEIESHFNHKHFKISGWSLGYRKEDFRYEDFGHLLNGKIFRSFKNKFSELKIGGGAEWGTPGHAFDKTRFDSNDGKTLKYSHVFLDRNSNVPGTGTYTDGVLYPFVEASLVKRNSRFIIESGVRGNIMRFGADDYTVLGGKLDVRNKNTRKIIPSFFLNAGFRL